MRISQEVRGSGITLRIKTSVGGVAAWSLREASCVVAQGTLGIKCLYGMDTPKDYDAARRWLTLAAERGASRPTFHLGRMHEEGWGVPVDYRMAGQLYQKAADRGEWLAYVHL